jgi:hypothetical protein
LIAGFTIRSFPMLGKDKRDLLRAAWDFFVLFSGISTASNLTRTQGRQILSRGLFLVRPPLDKKPPGPPREPTEPVPPLNPQPHTSAVALARRIQPQDNGEFPVAAIYTFGQALPLAVPSVVLNFRWESEEFLKPLPVEPAGPGHARLSGAGPDADHEEEPVCARPQPVCAGKIKP